MMETTDGTVITQFRVTETHSGTYKSVPATGARITFSTCNILTFDGDGKIIAEEAYYDESLFKRCSSSARFATLAAGGT